MGSKRGTVAALALLAVACDDPLTPPPTREITLFFCSEWAAYQNEGADWTVLPSVPGPVTFEATDRLGIATATRIGPSQTPLLEVYYLTAEQAEATLTCSGLSGGTPPSKRLRGSVAGLSPGATVAISMGRGVVGASAGFLNFEVRAPRDAPADLLAAHRPFVELNLTGRTDRLIVRRGEDHPDGATMPVLDFSSSEVFTPQSNTLTIAGVPTGSAVSVYTHLMTARGASVNLNYDFEQRGTVVTTQSLPASRIADGDLHWTSLATSERSVQFFYRDPGDRTVALGPAASTPSFTPSGPSGRAVQIEIPAQSSYGAQVSIRLTPPQPSMFSNVVVITATREYFGGTPTTWSLVLPDFTDLSGFSPAYALAPILYGGTLTVTGLPYGFSPTSARDGDVYRGATAFGIAVTGSGNLLALRR